MGENGSVSQYHYNPKEKERLTLGVTVGLVTREGTAVSKNRTCQQLLYTLWVRAFSPLITSTLSSKYCYFHFTDEETGAWKNCLLRKADLVGERAGIGLRAFGSTLCDPPPHYASSLFRNFR